MPTRNAVYKAIDNERDYQDNKWAHTGLNDNGALDRTIDEFSLYISHYTNELVRIASTSINTVDKLHAIRKVAGLCVACMEAHGAPIR